MHAFDIAKNSQTIAIDFNQVSVPFTGRVELGSVSWETRGAEVAPLTLAIAPLGIGDPLIGATMLAGRCTNNPTLWGGVGGLTGGIMVQYGAGGATQSRIIDARSGRYQLPPCNYAKATVIKWNETALSTNIVGQLGLSITEGEASDPSEATVTCAAASLAALSQHDLVYAQGARYAMAGAVDTGLDFTLGGFPMVSTARVTDVTKFPSQPRWDLSSSSTQGSDVLEWVDLSNAITTFVNVTQYVEF